MYLPRGITLSAKLLHHDPVRWISSRSNCTAAARVTLSYPARTAKPEPTDRN
jgi:hypothetical protein